MARVVLTPGLQQLRGRVAGFVYRVRNGKQTLSKAPDLSRVAWSPAQGEHRQRFRRAVAYARAAMAQAGVRSVVNGLSKPNNYPLSYN